MASATVPAYLPAAGGRYYRHSGHITVDGVLMGLAVGVFGGALLGMLYAWLLQLAPWVILRVALAICFGAALGVAPGLLMRARKVRSLTHGVAVVAVGAITSFYVSWCFWIYLLMHQSEPQTTLASFLGLLLQPQLIWKIAGMLAVEGVWGLDKSGPVSGIALWIVWGVEALVVIGGAILAARHQLWRDPFCESCQSWCEVEGDSVWVGAVDANELKSRLEAGDFHYLEVNRIRPEENWAYYRVDLHRCPCRQTQTLSVNWVTLRKDGNRNEKLIVDKLLVSGVEAETVRKLMPQPLAPAP